MNMLYMICHSGKYNLDDLFQFMFFFIFPCNIGHVVLSLLAANSNQVVCDHLLQLAIESKKNMLVSDKLGKISQFWLIA